MGLEVQQDLGPADWFRPRLRRWGAGAWPPRVDSLVPPAFPAYARILARADGGAVLPVADLLVRPLLAATTTPEGCWYAIWDGYGHLRVDGPAFETCQRRYHLLRGPVFAAAGMVQPPDLWWPEDRAWFLAGDPDQRFVFLGAARDVVELLVLRPDVRADRVDSDWPIDLAGEADHPFEG
jgi:hypothetical protein